MGEPANRRIVLAEEALHTGLLDVVLVAWPEYAALPRRADLRQQARVVTGLERAAGNHLAREQVLHLDVALFELLLLLVLDRLHEAITEHGVLPDLVDAAPVCQRLVPGLGTERARGLQLHVPGALTQLQLRLLAEAAAHRVCRLEALVARRLAQQVGALAAAAEVRMLPRLQGAAEHRLPRRQAVVHDLRLKERVLIVAFLVHHLLFHRLSARDRRPDVCVLRTFVKDGHGTQTVERRVGRPILDRLMLGRTHRVQ